MPTKVNILGVDIDSLSINQAIDEIVNASSRPGARYIAKPYVEFFRKDDEEIKNILNNAWLNLPDGVALQWAAYFQTTSGSFFQLIKTLFEIVLAPRKINSVLPEKFAGTNFTWPLIEEAAKKGRGIYLVGSPVNNDIKHTAEVIKDNIAGINIAGMSPGRDSSGVFSDQLEKQLLDDLKRLRPDIVLVGIGFPRQEKLISRLAKQLDHGVLIGEGGTFDYDVFGGSLRKAPKWMQRSGIEWLWRLILQPSRIKRQLAIPIFIWQIYRGNNSK
ncbi:MAG: WecB/TagA/CpsF family glycosyltransferase [Candidatus Saccharimonadales bacterium]